MIRRLIKKVLPNKLFKLLISIKNTIFDGFAIKSYSQEGEDMILRRIFEEKENGFYIDVGAHHPKRFSNTFYFYKKGWNGINIDAMPGSMKRFQKIRPRDINIEKPLSERNQVLTYYAFNEPALNGFSKNLVDERIKQDRYYIKFTKNIETVTLEQLLDDTLEDNQEIDFLTIDVEGLDFEVLKSSNFEKYKPKVILIEILNSSLKDIENHKISQYLAKYNYTVYAKAVNTVIFKNNLFLG